MPGLTNPLGNIAGNTNSGNTNTFTITNPSNTASSAARNLITVGGGSAGDPVTNWNVSGVTDWTAGIDNSDSDNWKLSQGTALGTNQTIVAYSAGSVTKPRQPAFMGTLSGGDVNVTGDGSFFQVGTSNVFTINYDQQSNFTAAGLFTAPVTGIYMFTVFGSFVGLTVAHNAGNYYLVTTLGSYFLSRFNPFNVRNNGGGSGFMCSISVPMNATNQAYFAVDVGGGAKTVGLEAGATYFAGHLIC